MVLPGFSWFWLALVGSILLHLDLFSSNWLYFALLCSFWLWLTLASQIQLTLFASSWLKVALACSTWLNLALVGCKNRTERQRSDYFFVRLMGAQATCDSDSPSSLLRTEKLSFGCLRQKLTLITSQAGIEISIIIIITFRQHRTSLCHFRTSFCQYQFVRGLGCCLR